MNPYLPDVEEFQKYYDSRPHGEVEDAQRIISFTHPYRTVEDVEKALDKAASFSDKEKVYARMSPTLKTDKDAMLQLVRKDARAYAYALNKDRDFNVKALKANPLTYSMLPSTERDSKEISDAYLESMRGQISRVKISPSEHAMMYKHQFSENVNMAQVFSSENYQNAYREMIEQGAYNNGAYSEKAMYIATARMMAKDDPELLKQYDNIEKDLWYDNVGRNKLKEAAYNDRNTREEEELLLAAEERCPEMVPSIERQKQQYRADKEQMLKLTLAEEMGINLEPQQREMLQQLQMKRVELSEKEKERMTKAVEKSREESAHWMKSDASRDIIAAYVAGDISLDDALSGAGKVQGLQTRGSHGKVVEIGGQAEDLEQSYAQDISDPEHSPGSERDEAYQDELEEQQQQQQQYQEEERDLYEEQFAGNPFLSYEDPNGIEPTFNPFADSK